MYSIEEDAKSNSAFITRLNMPIQLHLQLRPFFRYLSCAATMLLLLGWSPLSDAETYSECILENMHGVNSERGAYFVKEACKKKVLPYVPSACKVDWCTLRKVTYVSDKDKNDYLGTLLDGNKIIEKSGYESGNPECKAGPQWTDDPACVEKCLEASWWSKKFGKCKP